MKTFPSLDNPSQHSSYFNNNNGANYCSVNLPTPQALASPQATCAQRCFIVCSPHTLPVHVLKKIFCRFGNLIDVYLLNNRNCGYVKYATVDSARQVIVLIFGRKNKHKCYLGYENIAWSGVLWCTVKGTRSWGTFRIKETIKIGWINKYNFIIKYEMYRHILFQNNIKKLL